MVGPLTFSETEYIQNLTKVFTEFNSKKKKIILENDELKVVIPAEANAREWSLGPDKVADEKLQISKKIMHLLDLTDEAQSFLSKEILTLFCKKIQKLILQWDTDLTIKEQYILNLNSTKNFLETKINKLDLESLIFE
ncbi:MAG: hypothetical protein L0207_04945 [Chlamydiae bacterium]|nr:hypothetical protein [Chlamydiota bacterium]